MVLDPREAGRTHQERRERIVVSEPLERGIPRFGGKEGLSRGKYRDGRDLPDAALGSLVEHPHRFDLVTRELQPDRIVEPERADIDNAPAESPSALLVDGLLPGVAGGDEPAPEVVHLELHAPVYPQRLEPVRGRNLLQQGGGGHDHDRIGPSGDEPGHAFDPVGDDAGMGRLALVGKHVVLREVEHIADDGPQVVAETLRIPGRGSDDQRRPGQPVGRGDGQTPGGSAETSYPRDLRDRQAIEQGGEDSVPVELVCQPARGGVRFRRHRPPRAGRGDPRTSWPSIPPAP
ncbi:MAG: hypothetical protein BWX47_00469 [candidate division Hyd24-12 bacterium ADurb.Bin004]|nr:MAG: hypothetical protein BWX47_00469 [candidate division Hyd24-12 bacterium ADurb.Bin004]